MGKRGKRKEKQRETERETERKTEAIGERGMKEMGLKRNLQNPLKRRAFYETLLFVQTAIDKISFGLKNTERKQKQRVLPKYIYTSKREKREEREFMIVLVNT